MYQRNCYICHNKCIHLQEHMYTYVQNKCKNILQQMQAYATINANKCNNKCTHMQQQMKIDATTNVNICKNKGTCHSVCNKKCIRSYFAKIRSYTFLVTYILEMQKEMHKIFFAKIRSYAFLVTYIYIYIYNICETNCKRSYLILPK